MKVCHLITYYLPVTQNWIYNQLAYNRECEPSVLCQRLIKPEQFPLDDVFPICKSSGASSIPARLAHKIFERYPSRRRLGIIEEIKPDVLHGHFLLEPWRNYRLIKKSGLPLVTTCYGQDITSLPRKIFWAQRCRKIFELCGMFIVEGACMADTLASLGCPREKIRVIKLGIDIERIVGDTSKSDVLTNTSKMDEYNNIADERRYLSPRQKTIRILFVGLNREKKGALYAAEAFARAVPQTSADIELHLLGDGIYRKPVEKILTGAGVMQKAVFHGTLPVARYYELLKNIDILLAPSVTAKDGDTEGGAPVAVIEALCAGVPVVGTRHCDIPNIVEHGASGLLSDERDADALTKNIITLAENRSLRINMGEQGAKYILREHDIKKQVQKIAEVYTEVIIKR